MKMIFNTTGEVKRGSQIFQRKLEKKISSIKKEGQREINVLGFFVCLFYFFKQSGKILVCTLKYMVFMVYTYN